jgi:hypothetical protein
MTAASQYSTLPGLRTLAADALTIADELDRHTS